MRLERFKENGIESSRIDYAGRVSSLIRDDIAVTEAPEHVVSEQNHAGRVSLRKRLSSSFEPENTTCLRVLS